VNIKSIKLFGPLGGVIAVDYLDGKGWQDPYGGIFSEADNHQMEELLAGRRSHLEFNGGPLHYDVRVIVLRK
jgi:hypothetical protein